MIPSLPQRGRWNLLDCVVSTGDDHVVTQTRFTEEDVEGHFPGDPVVPGALLLEAAAQSLLVLSQSLDIHGSPRLAGLDRARFLVPVRPNEQVTLTTTLRTRRANALQAEVVLTVEGTPVASVRVTGTTT